MAAGCRFHNLILARVPHCLGSDGRPQDIAVPRPGMILVVHNLRWLPARIVHTMIVVTKCST